MKAPTKKPKAIIFDVDETLTERITWYELTEKLGGSTYRHADIYTQLLDGQINYQTAKKELFKIWNANGPVHKDKLIKIFNNIHIKGEAVALINTLQKQGYTLCLISGSIDMFVKILAARFKIEYAYGNSKFIFDKKNTWVDLEYTQQEGQLKIKQFQDFLNQTGYSATDCLVIGDGDNDKELFRIIPGIVVGSQGEHLKELAWQSVKYLPRIIQILEILR